MPTESLRQPGLAPFGLVHLGLAPFGLVHLTKIRDELSMRGQKRLIEKNTYHDKC